MQFVYTTTGTTTPFSSLTADGMVVALNNPSLAYAVIRIGPELIDLKVLGASPQIIPTAPPAAVTTNLNEPGSIPVTVPPVFLPSYSYGNPLAVTPAGISVFSNFGTFISGLPAALAAAAALRIEARGTYDRATNTFNAISVSVVL